MPSRRLTTGIVVAFCTGGLALAGCSSGPGPTSPLKVSTPSRTTVDDTHGVVVSGASPGHSVTLEATVIDNEHATWKASATYTADGHGRVDTATQAPRSGSYRGVEPTGLVATMIATKGGDQGFAFDRGTYAVTYRASQEDRSPAEARQVRSTVEGVTMTDTDLGRDGIVGTFVTPVQTSPNATAVLVLGGSEGGDGAPKFQAEALAQHGHPAVAIAYFKEPGLPQSLQRIPLEYFGRALAWLGSQPGVDPSRIAVMGGSRGSEATLLVALHYPQQIAGVVPLSPTDTVHQGLPDGDAWTWQGRPIPMNEIPTAQIPVPILLVCGEDDQLWSSCPSSANIDHRGGGPRTVLSEPGAGHFVDFLVPDIPLASGASGLEEVGGTVAADAHARLDAWPKVLTFLDELPALG